MTSLNCNFSSLIIGGCGDIGFSVAKTLLTRGDYVVVFDHLSEDHEKVLALKRLNIPYFKVDISNVESVKKGFFELFKYLKSKNQVLNLLVNSAGITMDNLAVRMTEEEWNIVLDVNLKGTFFCTQQAIKHMIKIKKGYIINLSSVVALSGNSGQVNYSASKAGIIALTKTLSQEYASRNILVNAIAPGFIKTGMTDKLSDKIKNIAMEKIPLKRFGIPQEVANLVEFLSSGKADYITGQVINLNGGML